MRVCGEFPEASSTPYSSEGVRVNHLSSEQKLGMKACSALGSLKPQDLRNSKSSEAHISSFDRVFVRFQKRFGNLFFLHRVLYRA